MTSTVADGRRLAGFWLRALGALLDALLVVVLASVAVPAYLAAVGTRTLDLADPNLPLVAGAVVFVAAVYDVAATRLWGGTLGKRVAGLRVLTREGERPGTGQLVARLLGRIVSALPALLGFLWVGWDPRKQTWHDRLADTVVVRDEEPAPLPMADDDAAQPAAEPRAAERAPEPPGMQPASNPWQPSRRAEPVDWRPPSEPDEWAPPREAPTPSQGSEWAPPREAPAPEEPMPPAATQPSPPAPWTPAAPVQAPAWSSPPASPPWDAAPPAPQAGPAPQGGLAPPPQPRNDANLVAVSRAGLGHDAAVWLQQVAGQVDARLDRLSSTWRGSPHAEAARACAFGLLIGHLARLYPHMRPELHATAELHPSFTTLLEGSRLATLEQIVAEPGRMAAWLGPLVDVQDPERFRTLLD